MPLIKKIGWGPAFSLKVVILRCFEDIQERGHPARLSRRNCTHAAGRMPALPGTLWFLGARQPTSMSDCFENACAEGTLECGSVSYRRSLEFHGGSFAAALHDGLRILMVSGCPSADEHERLP